MTACAVIKFTFNAGDPRQLEGRPYTMSTLDADIWSRFPGTTAACFASHAIMQEKKHCSSTRKCCKIYDTRNIGVMQFLILPLSFPKSGIVSPKFCIFL